MKICLIFILALILFFIIQALLIQIDLKTDYSNKDITYYFHADNGFFINVPYFIWQINKQKVIEQIFSESIIYEGKTYIVTAIFKRKKHLSNGTEIFPNFLYRDFMATVELQPVPNNVITNINQVVGNNNTISNNTHINQQLQNIVYNIDTLLQSNINDTDKQSLELFKLKLQQNSITEKDKNRVLCVLTKLAQYAPYASLASSIINLIKSLLP